MATIIRQLLDFARRGRGREQSCDVNAVIDDTLKMLSPIARAARVRLLQTRSVESVRAAVGAKALQQVLLNLAVNGIQAMPDGGDLGFVTETVESSEDEAGRRVRIAVSDSGLGIDAKLVPHVFEPFFTTKPSSEGTGLGLPIASEIVADCGGRIELPTSGPSGTTFHIFLLPEFEQCSEAY